MSAAVAFAVDSDSVMLLACAGLAVATLAFIFWIQPDPADSAPHRSRLDQLIDRRDAIYENLRDLKFEYRAGKFAEPDYEQMKDALEREAAQVLAEMEKVTGGPARLPRRDMAKSQR
ncbi:MAG TPA: hypothetical protein VEH50_13740 [Methylomirabilota bacterium]|jgi:hypothetical protein|nr:hypothetical protein [Methylomirabilota bacterium]